MAGTVTVTTPSTDSAAGFTASSMPIVWAFAGTSGASQVQWRVTMRQAGGGTPPTLIDSGWTTSSATTYTVSGLASGVSYVVTVQVVDTAGAKSSANRTIVATYTRSVPPVLTATPVEQGILLTVSNPIDGSRPQVTGNRLYRRETGSTGPLELIASVGVNGTFLDRTCRSATSYDYFARGMQG